MNWQSTTISEVLLITERAQTEPVRTFAHQLRRLGFETRVTGQLSPEITMEIELPHVIFVDAMHAEFRVSGAISSIIHNTWPSVPVLVVGLAREVESIHFQPGIADFLFLPIVVPELEARLRFVTWKEESTQPAREIVEYSGIRMNLATYEAWVHNRRVELTYKEFELLRFFLKHPRRVFSRSELLEMVWDSDYYGDTRTVDVHIRRLRAKLESPADGLIHTVRNVGYRFG